MIEVIFSDGTQRFDSFRDAQKAVERKLRRSRSVVYRKLKELKNGGTLDLSEWRSPYATYAVLMPDGDTFSGTFLKILQLVYRYDPDIPKDRVYRRLTRSRVIPVPLSALIAPPAASSEAGAKGGAVIAFRTATLFAGVEGHPDPVSATALYAEWRPVITKKCLYRRLMDGVRIKADLTAIRLTRGGPQGRPRTRPLKPEQQTRQHLANVEPEITDEIQESQSVIPNLATILKEAERLAPPVTTRLPPMRDYRPAQTYIRGT